MLIGGYIMLLCEIVTKTVSNDDGTISHQFDPHASARSYNHGIKRVPIKMQYEEQELFKRFNLLPPPEFIQVYYGYEMEKKPGGKDPNHPSNVETLDKLDAIKGLQRIKWVGGITHPGIKVLLG